jgi:histidinol-phosphate aminotransferase
MFKQSTRAAGATPVAAPDVNFTVSVDAILERVTPRTKLVFLANPNNPTGSYIAHDEVERLHRKLPGHIVLVLDAAYAEYVNRNDYAPGVSLVDASQNVIMLRTFSKLFALAGLRIGWGYGAPPIVDALNRVHGPFNVNIAAQAAGVAALADLDFQKAARAHNEAWMPKVQAGLQRLGLEPLPSVANFILVKVPAKTGKTAPAAIEHLASEGVFVREMATYGLPDHFRFSLGTAEENEILLAELGRFLGKKHV